MARPDCLVLGLLAALSASGGSACGDPAESSPVSIGVLLSYTGYAAANSINSERALLMALEAANDAGGIGGRPVELEARDTQSDARKVERQARDLLEAGVAVFIGPDNTELAVELKGVLKDQTTLMPSFTTTEFLVYKPHAWFVMGAGSGRLACELAMQVKAHGRKKPIVISDPNGYNSLLSWQLSHLYDMPQVFLPHSGTSDQRIVEPITGAGADAYVLAALPSTATALVYTMAALGMLGDPTRWYLSPTLHTPAFLETLPHRLLSGAHGVASGTVAGAASAFREAFTERWHDQPLDDAYPFYDAAAIAVLALQRAVTVEGAVPTGIGLGKHIVAVTRTGGAPVAWNELARGLALLREGKEVNYIAISGPVEFDISGMTRSSSTLWWTIGPDGQFADVPHQSQCQ